MPDRMVLNTVHSSSLAVFGSRSGRRWSFCAGVNAYRPWTLMWVSSPSAEATSPRPQTRAVSIDACASMGRASAAEMVSARR